MPGKVGVGGHVVEAGSGQDVADGGALPPAVFQQQMAAGHERFGCRTAGGTQMGQTAIGGKERGVRLVAQDVFHDLGAFGMGDIGWIADQQMQAAGGERGVGHIGDQAAEAARYAMGTGIAPGDGQRRRADVQQQSQPAGALREEGDADAA